MDDEEDIDDFLDSDEEIKRLEEKKRKKRKFNGEKKEEENEGEEEEEKKKKLKNWSVGGREEDLKEEEDLEDEDFLDDDFFHFSVEETIKSKKTEQKKDNNKGKKRLEEEDKEKDGIEEDDYDEHHLYNSTLTCHNDAPSPASDVVAAADDIEEEMEEEEEDSFCDNIGKENGEVNDMLSSEEIGEKDYVSPRKKGRKEAGEGIEDVVEDIINGGSLEEAFEADAKTVSRISKSNFYTRTNTSTNYNTNNYNNNNNNKNNSHKVVANNYHGPSGLMNAPELGEDISEFSNHDSSMLLNSSPLIYSEDSRMMLDEFSMSPPGDKGKEKVSNKKRLNSHSTVNNNNNTPKYNRKNKFIALFSNTNTQNVEKKFAHFHCFNKLSGRMSGKFFIVKLYDLREMQSCGGGGGRGKRSDGFSLLAMVDIVHNIHYLVHVKNSKLRQFDVTLQSLFDQDEEESVQMGLYNIYDIIRHPTDMGTRVRLEDNKNGTIIVWNLLVTPWTKFTKIEENNKSSNMDEYEDIKNNLEFWDGLIQRHGTNIPQQ